MMILAIVGVSSLIASWIGVALLRRWAPRNLLDHPNERSSHSVPTPRGGGLAIAAMTLTGLCAIQIINPILPSIQFAMFVISCSLVAAISWTDDLGHVPSRWRFLVHVIAAVVVVGAFGPWSCLRLGSWELCSVAAGWILSILWVVGLVNVFNFMDGIDGIAGLQAIVAAVAWFFLSHEPATEAVAVLVACSTAGFLIHNWPPARIFMGDVGSAFLGFAVASMPLLDRGHGDVFDWTALFVVWPFVFDSAFTLTRRAVAGENIFRAHRSHLYQRMVIAGLSHGAVTLLYGALAMIGFGLAWMSARHESAAVALIAISMIATGLWALTRALMHHSIERGT